MWPNAIKCRHIPQIINYTEQENVPFDTQTELHGSPGFKSKSSTWWTTPLANQVLVLQPDLVRAERLRGWRRRVGGAQIHRKAAQSSLCRAQRKVGPVSPSWSSTCQWKPIKIPGWSECFVLSPLWVTVTKWTSGLGCKPILRMARGQHMRGTWEVLHVGEGGHLHGPGCRTERRAWEFWSTTNGARASGCIHLQWAASTWPEPGGWNVDGTPLPSEHVWSMYWEAHVVFQKIIHKTNFMFLYCLDF